MYSRRRRRRTRGAFIAAAVLEATVVTVADA
jgi:hypothetical protein